MRSIPTYHSLLIPWDHYPPIAPSHITWDHHPPIMPSHIPWDYYPLIVPLPHTIRSIPIYNASHIPWDHYTSIMPSSYLEIITHLSCPSHIPDWLVNFIYCNEVDGLWSYWTSDLTFQISEISLYNIPIKYSVVIIEVVISVTSHRHAIEIEKLSLSWRVLYI